MRLSFRRAQQSLNDTVLSGCVVAHQALGIYADEETVAVAGALPLGSSLAYLTRRRARMETAVRWSSPRVARSFRLNVLQDVSEAVTLKSILFSAIA